MVKMLMTRTQTGVWRWFSLAALVFMIGACSEPSEEAGGQAALGESCVSGDDCAQGFECVEGVCSNACTNDFDCAVGLSCVSTAAGDFCLADGGGAGVGEACSGPSDCAQGLACFEEPGGARFCVEPCSVSAPACPEGQDCVPVDGDNGFCDFRGVANNDPNNAPNNDPNNTPNNDPNNTPNNDPNNTPNNTPNNDPGCNPPCGPGETCVDGACEPAQASVCEREGDACDAETSASDALGCVVADNTQADRSCRAFCGGDEDCAAQAFCGEAAGSDRSVCLSSNCGSVLDSAEACGGVGANGGTCLAQRPGVFYCESAGTRAEGVDCDVNTQCAAGLLCVGAVCARPCDEGVNGACGQGAQCVSADTGEGGVGICEALVPGCEVAGADCDGDADDRGDLFCAAGDPLEPAALTCLTACDLNVPECPQGDVCTTVTRAGDTQTLCAPSNCSSPLSPADCVGIGDEGGNCLPVGNGALRCVPAGVGQAGDACANNRACAPGLACDGAFCRDICALDQPGACGDEALCEATLSDDAFGTCTPLNCDPECGAGELCFRGQCVDEGVCQAVGQPCDADTGDGDGLLCILGNSLDPQEATCHQVCDQDFDTCPGGSVCVGLDETTSICLRSNCDSPVESAQQCAAIDGSCLPLGNETYFCIEAGLGQDGAACEANGDCGAGLGCLQGECTALCARSPDSCDDERCVAVFGDDPFGLCGDGCLGFEQEGLCGPNRGCLPLTADSGLCIDVGDGAEGDACDPQALDPDCGEFLSCVGLGAEGDRCQPWCNLTLDEPDAACGDGELCLDAFEGLDAVGVCFPGCTPFLAEDANGCDIDGFRSCLPVRGGDAGVCQPSGDVAEGQPCALGDSILGVCEGGFGCVGDNDIGVCRSLCRTFSSVNEFESGCDEAQVCDIFGQDFGVCNTNVLPGDLQAGDACDTAGQWCSDDVLCLQVDQQGNNLCLPLCRSREGNADCPANTACELGFFEGDVFGLCL